MGQPTHREFAVERAEIRGVEIAFVREGVGGEPLLLVHGWPESKRIWWRNIAPLAAAGFEVVAPDLRGFADSGLAPDGCYDLAAHARDLHALMCGHLGHRSCAAVAGDLGGAVVIDLGLRFEGFVERQVLFNCPLPVLPDAYRAAGVAPPSRVDLAMAGGYFERQGREPEVLAAELDTPGRRRRYVAGFYTHRFWAAPGGFGPEDVEFMSEPFGDAEKLLAGWANYGSALGVLPRSEPPRFREVSAVPTLALYGPADHVIPSTFPRMCEVAFSELIGPFVVEGAGHFLQWESANRLNGAIRYFLR